jgi:hypothetical protein
MIRSDLKSFMERYAYQTRHGTELGADMVLDELAQHIDRDMDVLRRERQGLTGATGVHVCRNPGRVFVTVVGAGTTGPEALASLDRERASIKEIE